MKVAELQQLLNQLVPFVKAARASDTVTSEMERAAMCLEPFKDKTLAEFNDFLRMADEYVRTGVLPASAKGRARPPKAPKPPKLTVAEAAQKFMGLYERAGDPTLESETIDVELSSLHDLSIDELKNVAKELNRPLPPGLKKKPDIVAAFKRMIKEQKENHERNQPTVLVPPTPDPAMNPADTL
jgi:hypothetical protein